ncbi:MAG: nitrogen regulation protein NR(I) [Aeromonas sp.]
MHNAVWVVDDDNAIRWVLERALSKAGFACTSFADGAALLTALAACPVAERPRVIVSDIRMPGLDGFSLLDRLQQQAPHLPVIIMTAHSDLDSAVSAYQHGAFEYLPKPFDINDALALVRRASEHQSEVPAASVPAPSLPASGDIIGAAPAMQAVFRAIGRLSRSSISVLINGQSGTGKELVAQALHKHSPRAQRPLIALNMAAIPHDLIESELFGHEKGAFTGAQSVRQGRFEQANGGTLFLDEIGDMPLVVQTRLLRVLADGQFYRVGGQQAVTVDVRIIAATHQDLAAQVAAGAFREDLYHRLNVIRIEIPTLQARREDIPLLASHFLAQAAKTLAVEGKTLHPDTLAYLQQLPWPGNVRQLENVCRWLTVMAAGQEVLPSDLPSDLLASAAALTPSVSHLPSHALWQSALAQWACEALAADQLGALPTARAEVERILLHAALTHFAGHKQQAALALGWGRNTLTRKAKQLATSNS